MPSTSRLAAIGLAFAAITIVALSALARYELDREAELHREVIAGLHAKDSLEALRVQLLDLVHATRAARAAGGADALQAIERRAVEIDAELAYLAQHPQRELRTAAFDSLDHAARALVVNARSMAAARERGDAAAAAAAAEVERLAERAGLALEATLEAQGARINERTLAQIRVGESLRAYVTWLLAGSALVLVGLFGFYRWARGRERDARARIDRLAHFDTLTGLPNRALVADRLERELARARRDNEGFALLMFDLDGFKQVNDTRGHAAGDALLAMVAARAREAVRASDTVGRVGGDEFLAILPRTGLDGARQVAEKLRTALARPYPLEIPVESVSASVGAALFPQHGADAESLQRAADAALYEAKRGGRNRVAFAAAPAAVAKAPEALPA